jgi:formylglycine-generating enzyme required for sulfatase activity
MPGELMQCAGCHEKQNYTAVGKHTIALRQPPAEIKPWHGPERGFSYPREVQPVIDKHCVSCHDGQQQANGVTLPNFRGDLRLTNWSSVTPGNGGGHAGKFSLGYANLHRYVRRPGIESDYHLLEPLEFHADTTELVQLLKRGHYGVKLDAEAWDRLITWIDMNCVYHGTWSEELAKPGQQAVRRRELLKLYGGVDSDPEAVVPTQPYQSATPPLNLADQLACRKPAGDARAEGWPFDAAEAQRRQSAAGNVTRKTLDLGDGLALELALIPAGEFLMGSADGEDDERPLAHVRIEKPFWMAVREIDNRTFNKFDATHDSRIEDKNAYQFGVHGYPANRPEQPVVRVSWQQAMAFCRWLSARTGQKFTLPTEAQWEYACRAGAGTPFSYGGLDTDFSKHANFADAKLSEFASDPYTVDVPLKNPTPFDDWLPKDKRFNDGALLTVAPGKYLANAWGLHDLHGNAAEWTRTTYQPQPADGEGPAAGRKVVRGGSWHDVPRRGTASFRLSYQPWQRVYNVGFRVICEPPDAAVVMRR